MTSLENLAILHLISGLLVSGFWGLFNNELLFHSDLFSLFVFMEAVNILVWLPLAAAYLVLHKLSAGVRQKAKRFLATGAVAVFLTVGGTLFYGKFSSLWSVALIFSGSLIVSFGIVFFIPTRDQIVERTSRLAVFFLISLLIPFVCSIVWIKVLPRLGLAEKKGGKRHMIFLLVDAMTKTHMKSYNDLATEKPIDRLARDRDAMVFANMHTNAVWTYGFNSVLFSGRKDLVFEEPTKMLDRRDTLFSLLQEAGVKTRWITFHNNGVPESNGLNKYKGIRSQYVTEHWSWLLDLLDLDYHVYLYGKSASRHRLPKLDRQALDLVNSSFDSVPVFPDYVLEEVKRIQRKSNRSFLYVHLCSGWFGAESWTVPESLKEGEQRLSYLSSSEFHQQCKVYGPEDEEAVKLKRKFFEHDVEMFGEQLKDFLDRMAEEGILDDTVVIVTADHGFAMSNSRYGYQFNWEEETVAVPFFVFNAGRKGVDDRNLETIDVTESILDYFGIDQTMNEQAVSIFSNQTKSHTTSVTTRCDPRQEWMVIVYRDPFKYGCNIHPNGDSDMFAARVDRLETVYIDKTNNSYPEIEQEFMQAVRDYGLTMEERRPCY